jgi:two-component system, OmpR family, response regulator
MTVTERTLQHVACVDDDADILQITKFALEEIGGLTVTAFEGPRAALEGMAAAQPDLILMDVMMPEMDGPTALKMLKKQDGVSHIPVVFMTARVQPHELRDYMALGAAGVISKPYDPVTLTQQLVDIWRRQTPGRAVA